MGSTNKSCEATLKRSRKEALYGKKVVLLWLMLWIHIPEKGISQGAWLCVRQLFCLHSQSNYHAHARPTICTYDPNILSAFGIKHEASIISRTSAHSGVTDLCLLLYPQCILSLLTRHYFSSLLLEWPRWTLTTLGSRLCWCQFRGSCRATATLVWQWLYTPCMRTHNSSELDIIMCVVNEQHCMLRIATLNLLFRAHSRYIHTIIGFSTWPKWIYPHNYFPPGLPSRSHTYRLYLCLPICSGHTPFIVGSP